MFDRPFHAYQVGERWQSGARTITETDLMLFSSLSGDWNPLHTDREWAEKNPFVQPHGLLGLWVVPGLILNRKLLCPVTVPMGCCLCSPLRLAFEVGRKILTHWMKIAKQIGGQVT